MGLYPSKKPVASIPASTGDNPGITIDEPVVLKSPDEKLTERKYVDDTVHNLTGVNAGRRNDIINDLKGFAEGSVITVTYYKNHYSETDCGGRIIKTENSLNPAHRSLLKIQGFEMRLLGALQYEFDQEERFSKLSGEAATYPGFEPEVGDKFIMDLGDGRHGSLIVNTKPTRMSVRAATYFKIQFTLEKWVTEEEIIEINKGVTDVAIFDKERFLAEPGALLRHDEYVEMQYLTKQRAKMVNYYNANFLDQVLMYSYMRPDGKYDPYVMEFVSKIFSFGETGSMAIQLYQNAPYLEYNFWTALLDPNVPLESVPTSTESKYYTLGSKTVLATSLLNKEYLSWKDSMNLKDFIDQINSSGGSEEPTPEGEIPPDPTIPHISEDDSDDMIGNVLLHIHPHYQECPWLSGENGSSLIGGEGEGIAFCLTDDPEHFKLVSEFLLTRKINTLQRLHTLIENVWKLPKLQQFYKMPIYIWLAQTAIKMIHHTEGIFDR